MSSHDELRVSLGSFVLGNLDVDEHQDVEAHLRTCQACRAELALLQPLTGLLDLARTTAVDQVQASSLLEQRVLEDHRRASEAAAGSSPSGSVARRRRSRWRLGRRWSMPAAGALVGALIVVGIVLGVDLFGSASRSGTTVALRPAVNPGEPGAAGAATAAITRTGSGSQVTLDAQLPPSTGRQVYEVWFVSSSGRVSAGTFRVGSAGRAKAQLGVAGDAAAFERIGITREPDADDPSRNGETVVSAALAG